MVGIRGHVVPYDMNRSMVAMAINKRATKNKILIQIQFLGHKNACIMSSMEMVEILICFVKHFLLSKKILL